MLQSLSFTYNGISCEDMGVVMVTTDSGLYKDIFLPSRKITEKNISGRNAPYFQRVESEPLSFSISIYIENWEEENSIRRIARWLYQDYYKPLWFESNPHNVYYALVEGSSELVHNGLNDGYITLKFRTNSPYSFSPVKPQNPTLNVYGSLTKLFYNEGDLPIRPKMVITKTSGDGNVSITNNKSGETFTLTSLRNGEVVTVDCSNETLVSSHEIYGRYLYDNHNEVWLDWSTDHNNQSTSFTFTGNFTVDFTFQYTYLNESNILRP